MRRGRVYPFDRDSWEGDAEKYPSLKAQFAGCLFQGAEAPCSLRNFMGPKPDAALGTTDEQLDV